MMRTLHKIVLFISGCFLTFSMFAQTYKVEYLTADDGLSRNLVQDIFKDSKGYLWFATSKGLDRYDGYDFVHFGSSQRDNYIPSDQINCIREDKSGNFWIATENGLFFYSPVSGEIVTANQKYKFKESNLEKNIRFINIDENGNIWIGHDGGLSLVSVDQKSYSHRNILRDASVNSILTFNGNIFVGSSNKVFRLLKGNDNMYSRLNPEPSLSNLGAEVTTLFYDKTYIWIGTANGLYKYDPVTDNIQLLTHNPSDESSISSNVITDIRLSNDNQLIVGTLIGIDIYDYHKNKFKRINAAGTTSEVLNNDFVSSILTDEYCIWVGTEKGGVNKLIPNVLFFTNLKHDSKDPGSLSRNPVNAIYETSRGDLLIGTVEGGLNIGKSGGRQFRHITSQSARSISHNSVSSICEDFQKNIWIGTWGNGLNFMKGNDFSRPVFSRIGFGTKQGTASAFIAAVESDALNGGVWVGSRDGLDFIKSSDFTLRPVLRNLPYDEAVRFITGMKIDHKRRLWVASSNGLFLIDLKKSTIESGKISYSHFHHRLNAPESKIIEKINCVLETKGGDIWFGSNGNGIYKLVDQNGKLTFEQVDESKGLIDNVVYGMLEDETGSLWISTDKGLCAYNPRENSFRNFTVYDGLLSNQFYWDAFCKTKDGKMYFGNLLGVTSFDPLKYSVQSTVNQVAITQITVLNQNVYPARTIGSEDYLKFEENNLVKLTLNESDKTFSIEFSALNSSNPRKVDYSYRLKGFDENWHDVKSNRRFANFTNINSGNYVFEVRCTNPDGTWSNQISRLDIRIVPPFYKTIWFILLLVLAASYAVYYLISYRFKLMKEQEIHLKELVEERTREIEKQKEEIRHQAQKIEDATVDKIAFFTNITHEFRTPVTLILGPVDRALKLSTNPKVLEQLDIVKRNSRFLLSLINQLMDFRKIDSDKMEISRTFDDFIVFLEDIIIPFEDMARARSIHFKTNHKIIPPVLLFDKDSMRKVITNLLSNALKFTPDGGKISVTASAYTDKSDGLEKLYVAVKNSGTNIPEDELEKIFERFYQSKSTQGKSGNGQSGTGIGLYLCKRIVELNNGRIEARNSQPSEVSFRFIIPIERKTEVLAEIDGKVIDITNEEQTQEIHDEIKELSRTKPTLLIVDDNKDLRVFVRSFMSEDFNVLEAANGIIGLELTNRYQPDIIISDIMMPEMDGIEFCKRVKSNFSTSHIPVVFLTAKSATDTQVESYKLGADAFLVKPFDEDLLKALIKNLAEKKHKIQNNFAENMDTAVLEFDDESQDKKFLDKSLQVLKENYTNPDFDVAEFIDLMAISRSLLHKKLTILAGQSASRFIRTYRLNMARELIIKNRKSHSLNISEIAYQVGFNDPKYFTRCFNKHFGIQPSNFMEDE